MTFYTFPNIHHIHIFRDAYEAKVEYLVRVYLYEYIEPDTLYKMILS